MSVIATYGHGTHNDFLLIYDPSDQLEISKEQVTALCNRSTGIGADGLIKITLRDGKWFMDYRNSDGSLAEMCGNGIRVMARYLVDRGYQDAGIFSIATRSGMKFLKVPEAGDISVNMGQVSDFPDPIFVENQGKRWQGFNIDVGNPHAVVFVDSLEEVGSLTSAPQVDPESEYPDGVNVEFVEIQGNGELKMRVHERGSGETQSCGTGTCAVALAATIKSKKRPPIKWVIHPPGGRLEVEIDGHLNATLTGPAVLIADHEIDSYLKR